MKWRRAVIAACALLVILAVGPAAAEEWRVPGDFSTIQAAINDARVANGDRIFVGPGRFSGALVTKGVHLIGMGRAVIDSGPAHGSGMIMGFRMNAGSDGASISNLRFEVDLAIMNGMAVNNVTVSHCRFLNPVQAISNWRGSSWVISHNDITDLRTRNGGGIGILIGDYSGGTVTGNVVMHNTITGELTSAADEQGGYNGTGIVLYADFRWGSLGSQDLSANQVFKNRIALESRSALVGVAAFEMSDTRDLPDAPAVIHDNVVKFNDFRGTVLQIDLTPDNLGQFNTIAGNFGEKRGHWRDRPHNHHKRGLFHPHE